MHPALHPGSAPPRDDQDVEFILRAVPELAFFPELAGCVPDISLPDEWPPSRQRLGDLELDGWRDQVLRGLEALAARAERERSGGLAFLVRTLTYFLAGPAALPAHEHPLMVALLLRAAARGREGLDTPLGLAQAMDRWD
jgi:hypothetical protein